jgi:Pregnancy-associated plasma protein-A/Secretion system C-terminal sorting domain
MKYFLICLVLCLPLAVAAQIDDEESRCISDPATQNRYGLFFQHQAALQREIQRRQAGQGQFRSENTTYRIPVVFHILHYGEPSGQGTNIPSSQVYSQLEVLNEDFRRLNADFAQVPPQFQAVAGEANIEFYPARDNPRGQRLREPGINRIQVAQQPDFFWTAETFDQQVKPGSIWDPTRYLNVWVVDSLRTSSGVTAGYAQFPDLSNLAGLPTRNGLAQTDGVVVRFNRLGSITKAPWATVLSNPRFDRGRTLTHEVGHYLGLLHTFEGGCFGGDACDDTPAQDFGTTRCPTNQQSCGRASMIQNFMDFTDDLCMGLFSACQVQRMRAVLEISPRRRELLTSNVGVGDITTSLQNNIVADAVRVYPNPATGSVKVQMPTGLRASDYGIYNPLGQLVRQEGLEGDLLQIDFSTLSAGVYLLRVGTNQGPVVKKVVVER